MINLFLALVWLVLGVALIAYHAWTGDERFRLPLFGGISGGWLAVALCMYNLVRWWSILSGTSSRKAELLADAARLRQARRRFRDASTEPDPNFNLTDQPPPERPRNITDVPPSSN
jgi:hypothetical protein